MRRSILLALSISAVFAASANATIPNPSTNSLLYGVACVRSSECWAVGYYTGSSGVELNQALRFNGTKWSEASLPQPGGTDSSDVNTLMAVTCPAASTCWAVGDIRNSAGALLNEVLHWNGHRWSRFAAPQPGGLSSGAISNLDAVTCSSRASCWAVGVFTGDTGGFLNQILRWNGHKWSHVGSPDPGGKASTAFNVLEGVSCGSASQCWATGDFETSAYFAQALRWNGHRWTHVATPQAGSGSNLTSISCLVSGKCWSVGSFSTSDGATFNLALHWTGNKWVHAKAPQPGGSALNDQSELGGVSCGSAKRCSAVGYYETALGPNLTEAMRWDGRKWSLSSTPNPAGTTTGDRNELRGVSCVTPADCWAVGDEADSTAQYNLALHWNGHKWLVG